MISSHHSEQNSKPKHLSSSSYNTGMMTEIDCPASGCDYSSDSKRGVSIHFSSQHPEQEHDFSSRKTYSCDFCDENVKKYPYQVENNNNIFCSDSCSDKYKAKDGLKTECSECGKDIHISPSHVKEVDGYEQKNYFCDKDCESLFKSREWVGEDHPSWDGGRERLYCNECGNEFYVKPSKLNSAKYCSRKCTYKSLSVSEKDYDCANCGKNVTKKPYNVKGKNTTCSDECHKEFMRSIRKGEDNPCWNGGRFEYYGPNWNKQREKTLERDNYECQECEMSLEEHLEQFDQQLHVHHKVKRRTIIDEDNPTIDQFELANSLDNLVTLCNSCHKKLEGYSNYGKNNLQ